MTKKILNELAINKMPFFSTLQAQSPILLIAEYFSAKLANSVRVPSLLPSLFQLFQFMEDNKFSSGEGVLI